MMTPDEPIFTDGVVRYTGEVSALVVAESPAAAEAAAKLVTAELEPLPAVLTIEEALKADTLINPDFPDNICGGNQVNKGDAAAALADAEVLVDEIYTTALVEHAYLEPEVMLVIPRGDGGLEVQGAMQHPFYIRGVVAAALALPEEKVLVRPNALGGSFGGKVEVCAAMAARAAIAALDLGRPVKYTLSREDSFAQHHKRHGITFHVRLGGQKDGAFTALDVEAQMDSGAYVNETPIVAWKTTTCGPGPYTIPHVHYRNIAVMTNNVVTGAMRGFGTPQSVFAMEAAVNELAGKLGLSPLELRRKNLLRQGGVTGTGHVLNGAAVSISAVMEKAAAAIDFEKKYEAYSRPQTGHLRRGVGIACSLRGVSFGADAADEGRARLRLRPDGTVELFCPMMDMGQGSDTALSQICADALGLPLAQVRYMLPETAQNPDTGAAGASRGTFIGGNAILDAAEKLRQTIAEAYRAAPEDVVFADGQAHVGSEAQSFAQICERIAAAGLAPEALGEYAVPPLDYDFENGRGDAFISYTWSCQAAEVEVDAESGRVRLLNLSACHDAGRIIHPQAAAGQVSGGLAMGGGMALMERLEPDPRTGAIRNDNFDTYLLPTAVDMCDMDIDFEENPDDSGPFGGKSLGEPAMEPAAAAILGAVNMAIGRPGAIRAMPADLETVFFALHPEALEGEVSP